MPKGIYKRKPITEEHRKNIGKSKKGNKNILGKHWKLSDETKEKLMISKLGDKNPMFGKTTSDKQKDIVRKRMIENNPAKLLHNRIKLRNSHLGEKSPFWKGGKTKLSKLIKANFKYRLWREAIFKRDNWTCQECNFRNKGGGERRNIHPHHLISFATIISNNKIDTLEKALKCKLLWDINNGITLCNVCHKLTESYGNKMNLGSLELSTVDRGV